MQRVAQDWLVLVDLTEDSALAVGVVTGLQFLPMVLLAPWAGLIADRFEKRRILQVSQAMQGLLAAGLGALVMAGAAQVWHVYVFALALGVVTAFDAPARQTYVTSLVPAEDLPNAIGLNAATFHLGRLLGPASAGLLIAWVGTGPVFLINGLSFGFTVAVLAMTRTRSPGQGTGGLSGLERMREAAVYVRTRGDILLVLFLVFVVGTFGLNFQLTTAVMARLEFGRGPESYGLLGTFLAVGSLSGALLAASRKRARMRLVVGAVLAFGVTSSVAALMPTYWTFAIVPGPGRAERPDPDDGGQRHRPAVHPAGAARAGDGAVLRGVHRRHADRCAGDRLGGGDLRGALDHRRGGRHRPGRRVGGPGVPGPSLGGRPALRRRRPPPTAAGHLPARGRARPPGGLMEPLATALAEVRGLLVGPDLVRAVAAGRRRGAQPDVPRVELRAVTVSAGRRVVLTERHERAPLTRTLADDDLAVAVDALLGEPYGNWHVEHTAGTLQLRVTKRGEAQVHRGGPPSADGPQPAATGHDRAKQHRLAPDDPLFDAVGAGAAKRRQVDAFLGRLDDVVPDQPTDRPLRVVDLGCGNAYLTLAAHRWLSRRGPVETVGVDVREDVIARNTALVARIGETGVRFVVDSAGSWQPDAAPDVVLALHACDTATDEALAQAVGWGARAVLAAPCCHQDLRRQVDARAADAVAGAGAALRPMLRDGILRSRLLDTVTDALRADLLRLHGYRTDAVELVDPEHTPRNTLLRAVRSGAAAPVGLAAEVDATCHALGVRPRLADLLGRP